MPSKSASAANLAKARAKLASMIKKGKEGKPEEDKDDGVFYPQEQVPVDSKSESESESGSESEDEKPKKRAKKEAVPKPAERVSKKRSREDDVRSLIQSELDRKMVAIKQGYAQEQQSKKVSELLGRAYMKFE